MPTLKCVVSAAAIGCAHPANGTAKAASQLRSLRRCSLLYFLCTVVSSDKPAPVIPGKLESSASCDPVEMSHQPTSPRQPGEGASRHAQEHLLTASERQLVDERQSPYA